MNWIDQTLDRLVNESENGIKVPLETFTSETIKTAVDEKRIGQEVRQGESGPEFFLVRKQ